VSLTGFYFTLYCCYGLGYLVGAMVGRPLLSLEGDDDAEKVDDEPSGSLRCSSVEADVLGPLDFLL
jgi:hypothetical protein